MTDNNDFMFDRGNLEICFHEYENKNWKIYLTNKTTGERTTIKRSTPWEQAEAMAEMLVSSAVSPELRHTVFGKSTKATIANLKALAKKVKSRKTK